MLVLIMKPTLQSLLILGSSLLISTAAQAANYSDPGGVGDFTGGSSFLDISSISLNNDATSLSFTINVAGDPTTASWANYLVGISRNLYSGVGGNLNGPGGWGTDIQMSQGGMDYFVGAYPYWGTSEVLTWGGSSWSTVSGNASSETTSSATFTVSLAALGLSAGDTIRFDVWSQSSGNSVLDALSDGTSRTWNNNAFDTGANYLTYTVTAVPEPGTGALVALGGLLAFMRRKVSAR